MVVIHVLESVYTLSLCRKHRTPFFVGVSLSFSPQQFPYIRAVQLDCVHSMNLGTLELAQSTDRIHTYL